MEIIEKISQLFPGIDFGLAIAILIVTEIVKYFFKKYQRILGYVVPLILGVLLTNFKIIEGLKLGALAAFIYNIGKKYLTEARETK